MKLEAILLVVRDMEQSVKFYTQVLGLQVKLDFGANIVLENGIALQTLDTWAEFIDEDETEIAFKGKQMELVFEVEDLGLFVEKLNNWPAVEQVHPVRQYPWGQSVLRLYDPDGHIIEIGESMKTVVKRFLQQGDTVGAASQKSQYPLPFIQMCYDELKKEGKL